MRWVVALLALAACGGTREPQGEEAIANQAESLERAANATVDQQIAEIEAASNADQAVVVSLEAGNNASGE